MDFSEAIRKIIDGKKVTRLEWGSKDEYCCISGEFLAIHHKGDADDHSWLVRDGDLLATDWQVVESN